MREDLQRELNYALEPFVRVHDELVAAPLGSVVVPYHHPIIQSGDGAKVIYADLKRLVRAANAISAEGFH